MQSLSNSLSANNPILEGDNYNNWSVRVKQLLMIHSLFNYVKWGPLGTRSGVMTVPGALRNGRSRRTTSNPSLRCASKWRMA